MNGFDLEQYKRDGYAVLRGALSQDEVAELRAAFVSMFDRIETMPKKVRDMGRDPQGVPMQPEIYRPSSFDDAVARCAAHDTLKQLSRSLFNKRMGYVFDHAICKMPNNDAVTPLHQDQAYLGSDIELETINIWVPMQTTNQHNGTMEYVPGSHRTGLTAHHASTCAAEHLLEMDLGDQDVVRVDLEPGDIAIHHPLTAHRTGPNHTDAPRYAWAVHYGPGGRFGYLHPRHAAQAILAKTKRTLGGKGSAAAPSTDA